MRGRLLLRIETVALIGVVLVIGAGVMYFGYIAVKGDDSPIRQNANALECSQKKVEVISESSNSTHFTAYIESNTDFVLLVSGNGTGKVEKTMGAKRISVPAPPGSAVEAEFPGCERTVSLR